MTTLKRLLISLGLLIGLTAGADAATFYFANCAAGCLANSDINNGACSTAGTKANPYCLDVANNGSNESIGIMFDQITTAVVNPEAVSGSVVKLCATDCDGADTGTFAIAGTNTPPGSNNCTNPSIIVPRSANVTVEAYGQCSVTTTTECHETADCPGGETCGLETININGDVDNDGVVDAGDVVHFISVTDGRSNGRSNWIIRNLNFKRSEDWTVCTQDGLPGWVFDGVTLSETDSQVWGDANGFWDNCPSGEGRTGGIFLVNCNTAGFTFKNGGINTTCGSAIRSIQNPLTVNAANPTVPSISITNNTFFNTLKIEFWNTHNLLINNNVLHDAQGGINLEDRVSYVTIEGNTVECRGVYNVYTQNSQSNICNNLIDVNEGDNSPGGGGNYDLTHHITIRKNKIFARNTGVATGRTVGGLLFTGVNCDGAKGCLFSSDPGYIIENNLIYNIEPPTNSAGLHIRRAALGVWTGNRITIQNNTIHDSLWGLAFQAFGLAPTLRNNLIDKVPSGGIAAIPFPASMGQAASLSYNNLFDVGGGSLIRGCSATASDGGCNTLTAWNCTSLSCPNFPVPATNQSLASVFEGISGGAETWNLHLDETDINNLNKAPTGPSEDYDGQARPQGGFWEIGADEISSGFPCGGFEGDCERVFDTSNEGCALMGAVESFSPVQGRCSNSLTTVCTNGSECSGGGVCTVLTAGRCSTTQTTTCVVNGDCPVGTCSVSAAACHTAAECGLGQTCVSGESCVTTGDSSLVHGGTNTILLEGSSVGPQCGSVIVPLAGLSVGVTYRISCFYQATGSAAGDKKLSVTVAGVEKCSVTTNATSWTAFPTCDFVAGAATAELKFIKPSQAAGTTSYRIDDCTLVPQP